MTHSWKEGPEEQNLDSLDGWAKSNHLNCMRINADPFPEVLQSHLHLHGEGGAPKISTPYKEPPGSQLTPGVSQKTQEAARRGIYFGSSNDNLLSST